MMLMMSACSESHFKKEKILAGVKVSSETLNLGKSTYTQYCMACHGVNGDGQGVAAKGSNPAPRNLTQGVYKFGYVTAGELPSDEDFERIIKHGLNGTAMLPWSISKKRLNAVIQYIKTFAPKVWEKPGAEIGKKVTLKADPYTLARKEYAIKRGRDVYHFEAQCQTCHRAYLSPEEFIKYGSAYSGSPYQQEDLDKNMYKLKLQASEHIHSGKEMKQLPPDFTWHSVRSARTVQELALRLASGVGGTAMASWKDVLSDDDLYAVSYYLRFLMDKKGKVAERAAFLKDAKF